MITKLDSLLYQAEAEYLEQDDLDKFKSEIFSLEKRVQLYEIISSKETDIFQYVATQLLASYPDEPEAKIRRALKHWLIVMRYCGMSMLFDNPKYLQHRILEWLPEQITAHQLQDVERSLFSFLQKRLTKVLSSEQWSLLKPYFELAQNALLS
ncbi:MAG: phycobilisome protein [Cyanobacteria bacterium P01_G01_bin.67]